MTWERPQPLPDGWEMRRDPPGRVVRVCSRTSGYVCENSEEHSFLMIKFLLLQIWRKKNASFLCLLVDSYINVNVDNVRAGTNLL